MDVSAEFVELLTERHLDHLRQSLLAECDLVAVGALLRDAGIDFRVLKGCAAAHLDYPDPALRTTSDLDVLVRESAFVDAMEVLRPHVDWAASKPEYRPGWTARYGKALAFRIGHGWLDLHRWLAPGYWGLHIDHSALFERSASDAEAEFEVAGVPLRGLSRQDRLMHALVHAAMPKTAVQSMRDAVVLACAVGDSCGEAIAAAAREPANAPIAQLLHHGTTRLAATFDVAGLGDIAGSSAARSRSAEVALALTRSGRGAWTAAFALSPVKLLSFFGPILMPSRNYLAYHRQAHLRRLGGPMCRAALCMARRRSPR